MEYKLGITRLIHWDKEGIDKIRKDSLVQWLTTCEVGDIVSKQRLHITIIAKPIVFDDGVIIFSSIFNTTAILSFQDNGEPITDIINMWKESYLQEIELFKELGNATKTDYLNLTEIDISHFDSAYNLRDFLLQHNLVSATGHSK